MKTKFGVSLDSDLLEKFDRFVGDSHFSNRSEALAHLIKEQMKNRFIQTVEEDGEAFAVVSICFDHHKKTMSDILTRIQHNFLSIITSSLHIHVDAENCAEMVVCRGRKSQIMAFYKEISEIRFLVSHNLNFIYNSNMSDECHDENNHHHKHSHPHSHPHPNGHHHHENSAHSSTH